MLDFADMPGSRRETLPEFIKRIRAEKNLSLNDLVERSRGQISNSWASDLENGHIMNPGIIKLRNLARALAIPEAELLSKTSRHEHERGTEESFESSVLFMLYEERELASTEDQEFIDRAIDMLLEDLKRRRAKAS